MATTFLRSIDSIPTIPGVRQGLNCVPGVALPGVPEGTEETINTCMPVWASRLCAV